jgi:hypothetical protein
MVQSFAFDQLGQQKIRLAGLDLYPSQLQDE